jgi:hypothetical protein
MFHKDSGEAVGEEDEILTIAVVVAQDREDTLRDYVSRRINNRDLRIRTCI